MANNQSVEEQLELLSSKIDDTLTQQRREQEFANVANLKFEENLLAFKKYFPDIFEKFQKYEPNEQFQFILNDNGTANIIDYDTQVPMYSEDPIKQAIEQVNNNIKSPILGKTNHSAVSAIQNPLDFIHIDLMNKMGEVFGEAKANLRDNSCLEEKLPSLMLFGIGLGYHLPELIEKREISFINIIEPNEDYFFASLFVADWKNILESIDNNGSFLYLGVGMSEDEVFKNIYD